MADDPRVGIRWEGRIPGGSLITVESGNTRNNVTTARAYWRVARELSGPTALDSIADAVPVCRSAVDLYATHAVMLLGFRGAYLNLR